MNPKKRLAYKALRRDWDAAAKENPQIEWNLSTLETDSLEERVWNKVDAYANGRGTLAEVRALGWRWIQAHVEKHTPKQATQAALI